VMTDLKERCPDDPEIQKLEFPSFLNYLTENKYLGNKSGQGFYKKTDEKDEKGRSVILELNLESNEYVKAPSSDLKSLQLSKQIDDLGRRIKALWEAEDKGAELVRKSLAFSFLYSAARIPEISDNIYSIDQAMKAGFAWPLGPFEYADVVGVDQMIETGKEMSMEIPEWIHEFQKTKSSFYKTESSRRYYYDLDSKTHVILPGTESQINIGYFKDQTPVLSNDEMTVHDIGDGVLALEFTSKSNTIGEGILRGIGETISLAEEGDWNGLVIANEGQNFTVGANLMLICSLAFQQEFDELNMAVKLFQDTSMRIRTSKIPVVAATQGYVFGGGCEFVMHTDSTIASAESYIGLVEVGVGILPAGGGTKEFALRAADDADG